MIQFHKLSQEVSSSIMTCVKFIVTCIVLFAIVYDKKIVYTHWALLFLFILFIWIVILSFAIVYNKKIIYTDLVLLFLFIWIVVLSFAIVYDKEINYTDWATDWVPLFLFIWIVVISFAIVYDKAINPLLAHPTDSEGSKETILVDNQGDEIKDSTDTLVINEPADDSSESIDTFVVTTNERSTTIKNNQITITFVKGKTAQASEDNKIFESISLDRNSKGFTYTLEYFETNT